MRLGYTIVYVPDVAASPSFFETAFGLKQRFLHEIGTYGELETGETTLAFATHELGDMNFPGGHVRANESHQPLGMEIALVTEDVSTAHQKAVALGGERIGAAKSHAVGPDGLLRPGPGRSLIEIWTPVSG